MSRGRRDGEGVRWLVLGVALGAAGCGVDNGTNVPSSAGTGSGTGGASGANTQSGGASTASGGTRSTGGTSGTGGGAATTGGQGGAPPHTVAACDALGATGAWEQITPSSVSLDPAFNTPAGTNFGVHSF